jgi:hypothetical protein
LVLHLAELLHKSEDVHCVRSYHDKLTEFEKEHNLTVSEVKDLLFMYANWKFMEGEKWGRCKGARTRARNKKVKALLSK